MKNKDMLISKPLCSLLVLLSINIGCATNLPSGITPSDIATQPTVFCKVLSEPDPLLLGGWKCNVWGTNSRGIRYKNPLQYWLVKKDDKYAMYYYYTRYSGRDRFAGWRDWIINGEEIVNPSGSIRFFVRNGEVYFSWKNGKPIKMSRIQ
jgi:hypothetical protein